MAGPGGRGARLTPLPAALPAAFAAGPAAALGRPAGRRGHTAQVAAYLYSLPFYSLATRHCTLLFLAGRLYIAVPHSPPVFPFCSEAGTYFMRQKAIINT